MTQQLEAMKLALEALENLCEHLPFDWAFDELKSLAGKDEYREDLAKARSLIPIIEEALAKQEQGKPVALETVYETIIHWDEGGGKRSRRELARQIVALYTIQQQRQLWVGLTDKDKQTAFDDTQEGGGFWEFADAIEATLRKKNHG